jgi:hypothetical protein
MLILSMLSDAQCRIKQYNLHVMVHGVRGADACKCKIRPTNQIILRNSKIDDRIEIEIEKRNGVMQFDAMESKIEMEIETNDEIS